MTLKEEIKQNKPFKSTAQEAALNILRTADKFDQKVAQHLKSFELTPTQFNVLRILNGAGPDGWTCSDIASRMVKKDSDVTRLLDRLEKSKYILRERNPKDRRIINSKITSLGINLLKEISPHIAKWDHSLEAKMGAKKLRQLTTLLEEFRGLLEN